MTTFDSTVESLPELLRSIRSGKTQLPDFQRGWVWDDSHIRSLLASVSLAYPIGAVMTLQTGNANVRFQPRLIEGVSPTNVHPPERLILDGQQRLTALFQALFMGQPVSTLDARNRPIRRWYFLDIAKALDPNGDRDEAVVGLPEDRTVRNFRGEVLHDYSTAESQCAAELLPLALVFDETGGLMAWFMKYSQGDPAQIQQRLARWNALMQEVILRYQQYQIPLIQLRKETPKDAICQVFEKVNTGGVSLTVFELLTATYAADAFLMRENWEARKGHLKKHRVLRTVENTDFLQATTLLATRERRNKSLKEGVNADAAPGITCKRKDVLRLELDEYKQWAGDGPKEHQFGPLVGGFCQAARLLHSQKIYDARDLPYRTQLTPLAAVLTALRKRADDGGILAKLARWYWCGVLGELYGGAIETRFAKDLPEVLAWIDGGAEPDTVTDANFAPARLLTLRTRNSAAYKGLYALLMRDGGRDFRTTYGIELQMYFDDKIDIHHIFPQAWCKAHQIDPGRCDCVVNKAPISARTNRMIGGNAPSVYLPRMQKSFGISADSMDEILRSHAIDPAPLRADDFDAFFKAREHALLDRIEKAMGKPVRRDAVESGGGEVELDGPEEAEG